jgi:sugar O-acyltransferase (sialic acid O-acetyltransferase NeuD family)
MGKGCENMKQVILAGNATLAEIIHAYLSRDPRYRVAAATVDDEYVDNATLTRCESVPLSRIKVAFPPDSHTVIMAVGYSNVNRVRESLFLRLKGMGYAMETYVHPDARVYTEHPIGEGSLIFPGVVIEPHARVGMNCVVYCNTVVAHHSSIGDHCWIAPGAIIAGQTAVGRNTFVGANATVVNAIAVGECNTVGSAAFITRSTKPDAVHLAHPAELSRHSSDEYVKYLRK